MDRRKFAASVVGTTIVGAVAAMGAVIASIRAVRRSTGAGAAAGLREPMPGGGAGGVLAVCALGTLAGMVVFIWRVGRGTGPAWLLGLSGTFWMWSLALVLAVYRRHFVPDEIIEQDRDEEIPW